MKHYIIHYSVLKTEKVLAEDWLKAKQQFLENCKEEDDVSVDWVEGDDDENENNAEDIDEEEEED